MSLKNKSRYAILGIVNLSPCTGYDIKKYCDRVLSGFWNENFGHIYPTLRKMTEEGMLEVVSDMKSERSIRYGITAEGKRELQAWLQEETVPQPVRSEFMLKLLFSDNKTNEEIVYMLQNFREEHEKTAAGYRKMSEELNNGVEGILPDRVNVLQMVLRRGILSCEADISWCDEILTGRK